MLGDSVHDDGTSTFSCVSDQNSPVRVIGAADKCSLEDQNFCIDDFALGSMANGHTLAQDYEAMSPVRRSSLVKEQSSGFMLLSVKHLSKIKKETSLIETMRTEDKQENVSAELNVESYRESGSPLSQSPVCDEIGNELYGSGSIEAEEFEECDEPEDELELPSVVLKNRNVLVDRYFGLHRCSVQSVPFGSFGERHYKQSHYLPMSTRLIAKEFNSYLQSKSPINKQNPNQSSDNYSHSELSRHCSSFYYPTSTMKIPGLTDNSCTQPYLIDQCVYSQCPRERWHHTPVINLSNSNVISSLGPTLDQLGDSHPFAEPDHEAATKRFNQSSLLNQDPLSKSCDSQLITGVLPLRKSSYHNLPLTRSVATPEEHCSDPPYNSSDWTNLSDVLRPSYHIDLSTLSKHGTFNQAPITCLHHMHSATKSETNPPNLNSTTVGNHLTPEVVTLATSSLPPLQPASRFRKARIHETVEQWSHGRLSIHDCHLKAIPDWVNELQKKSFISEETVTNAVNKRVKCISCFIPKSSDHKRANPGSSSLILPHLDANTTTPTNQHIKDLHAKLAVLEDALEAQAIIFGRGTQSNNLFSFWNEGLRIHSKLPTLFCLESQSVSSDKVCTNLPDTNDPNRMVSNQISTKASDIQLPVYLPASGNCISHHKDSLPISPTLQINTNTEAIPDDIEEESLLNPNSCDPATAYLRRQHMNTTSVDASEIKCGESSSVNEACALSTDPIIVDAVSKGDELSQSLSNHIDSAKSPDNYSEMSDHHPKQRHCHTSRVNDLIPSNAPPTSPNVAFNSTKKSCSANIPLCICCSCCRNTRVSNSRVGLHDLVNGENHVNSVRNKHTSFTDYKSISNHLFTQLRNADPTLICADIVDNSDTSKSKIKDSLPSKLPLKSTSSSRPFSHRARSHDNCRYLDDGCPLHQVILERPHNSDIVKGISYIENGCVSPREFTGLTNGLKEDEYDDQKSKSSSVLSDRLEARIRASMEAIRSTLVNSFRDELANVLAENVNLRAELDRLNSELITLRSYQQAFLAVRPYVPSGVWEKVCSQQELRLQSLLTHPQSQFSCDQH